MDLIRREELHRGRVFVLRRDTLRGADGREQVRDVVAHGGAVVVLAEHEGELLFVRQTRHAVGEVLLELVAGTLEPGEEPEATAWRELQEEAGFKAGRLERLGEFFSAPGFCTELLHCYLATDLTPSRLPGDEDEDITVERHSLAEALEMARTGRIRDAKTLAGLLLYIHHGR